MDRNEGWPSGYIYWFEPLQVDDEYNIMIAEAQRIRVQIYQKDSNYFEAQFTL